MSNTSLADRIALALADGIAQGKLDPGGLHIDGGHHSKLSEDEILALVRLVSDAVAKGIPTAEPVVSWTPAGDGNSARAVVFAEMPIRLVVKVHMGPSLLAEARILNDFKTRSDIPEAWRNAFPRVLATTTTETFSAYVMEHFADHDSLAALMADPEVERARVERLVDELLEILFEAYAASPDKEAVPLRPAAQVLYIDRILRRLPETGLLAGKGDISKALNKRWIVNNREIASPNSYMQWLRTNTDNWVTILGPPFATFVHGDPHPKNVLIGRRPGPDEVRLIDPKGWGYGDYLYDVVKLAQFFDLVGAMRRFDGVQVTAAKTRGSKVVVTYDVRRESWEERILTKIREKTRAFAMPTNTNHDPQWELRYCLAMASMLLGVIPSQAVKESFAQTMVRIAAGLCWLEDLREALTAKTGHFADVIRSAEPKQRSRGERKK